MVPAFAPLKLLSSMTPVSTVISVIVHFVNKIVCVHNALSLLLFQMVDVHAQILIFKVAMIVFAQMDTTNTKTPAWSVISPTATSVKTQIYVLNVMLPLISMITKQPVNALHHFLS